MRAKTTKTPRWERVELALAIKKHMPVLATILCLGGFSLQNKKIQQGDGEMNV